MKALNIQEVAELSAAINATWREQAEASAANLPPVAGRRYTVVFPTAPTVGDAISVQINGTTISSTFSTSGVNGLAGLCDSIRGQAGVYACVLKASATYDRWRCVDASGTVQSSDQTGIGLEVLFEEGAASSVTLVSGSIPSATVVADTTEGVNVTSALRAIVHLPVGDTQASGSINTDQILLTAGGAYRGTAGNSIAFVVVVSGTNTAMSVSVSTTTITVNSATNSGGSATSTVQEVLRALQRSEAVVALVDVAEGSGYVAAQVIASESSTSLSGGANGSMNGDLWAMLDDGDEDGSGNHWVLVTPTAIDGALSEDTACRVDCSEYAYLYWQTTAVTGAYTPRIGLCGGAQ